MFQLKDTLYIVDIYQYADFSQTHIHITQSKLHLILPSISRSYTLRILCRTRNVSSLLPLTFSPCTRPFPFFQQVVQNQVEFFSGKKNSQFPLNQHICSGTNSYPCRKQHFRLESMLAPTGIPYCIPGMC